LTVPHGDPVAIELTAAIHGGDLDGLQRLLATRPELVSVHMIGRKGLEGGWRTPLHACWHVARLLVASGAKVDKLWHAAALGLLDRMEELLDERPAAGTVSQAFWHACAGGQRRAAEYLLARGADLTWVPDYAEGTPLDAASSLGTRQDNVIGWLRDRGAVSADRRD
jgi:hypothetical protein